MDYGFTTAPADFASALQAADIPAPTKAAIQAVWDATATSDPSYEVSAATGDLWTVIRVAAIRTQ
jgi:hypothetical protein